MSTEKRRRSSRISELEARNAQQRSQKKKMILDTADEQSDDKGRRKKVKTRPLRDLISDPVERQAHGVKPQAKKLLSDAFESIKYRANATTPMDPTTPLPDQSALELLLNLLQRRDSQKIFAEPVNPAEVKGYEDIIEDPMDFGTIEKKLSRGKYNSLEDFEDDVFLVFDNAMRFNQSTTVYYRQARAIREVAESLFDALRADPTNFESHFYPVILRCGRWTKAEAKILNSTKRMISRVRKGKRHQDFVDQRRRTYQSRGKENSLASDASKNIKTLIEAKEELDYKGSLMRYIKDLGPMAKFVAMRNLSKNLPQGSVPQNEVSHLQPPAVTYDVLDMSQGSFDQVAAARSVHQCSVQKNIVPALTELSYANPTRPPHLKLRAQSSNIYGGNVLSIGSMNRSEDPRFVIPKANHTSVYPTHQTGQRSCYMNEGLNIGNDSERNMTVGIPDSSSSYKPAATNLFGNPNPFAAWNFAPDSQGSSFSSMMLDAMRTDGPAKMGEVVSSYPGMQAIEAKRGTPLPPSWLHPSQGASSFPGNYYKDLGWRVQAAPTHEESTLHVGQRSNELSPINEGSSTGAGQLPQWIIPSKEGSSIGAGPVPNWLSLSHGGGSERVSNCANPETSKPQYFEFLCPRRSGPVEVDVMGQARIPKLQDQAPLHDARLRSVSGAQDARTRDPKGKSVMENEAGIHHPSPSPNVPRWFLG